MFSKITAICVTATVIAAGANASTIDVDVYGKTQLDAFQTDFGNALGAGNFVGEDFENLGPNGSGSVEGVVTSPFPTSVGTFEEIGGVGDGGTVKQLGINQSSQLALRDGSVYGRQNTWPVGGSWFLDSNDTWGFTWNVDVGSMFDSVMFSLTDGSDAGAYLQIKLDDGTVFEQRETGTGKLGDGNIALVVVDFGKAVSSATITVGNFTSNADGAGFRKNDGVGIDGAMVNVVPLPASMAFLIAGVGALGFARKRKS